MSALILFLQNLISPHPSIKEPGQKRRAQLLAGLSLTLTFFLLVGIFSNPRSLGVFITLGVFSILSYLLSRTKYHYIGAYIFSYSITFIGFLRIYQGTANSIETAVNSTVHLSLIIASALLSSGGFLTLTAVSVAATFGANLYSNIPPNEIDSIGRTGGIVLSVGALLYGINLFRAAIDRSRLEDLRVANSELTEIKLNLEQRVSERTLDLQEANHQIKIRAERLQTVSEISKYITENVDQNSKELMSTIVKFISEKTGYYHVGIFLLDKDREYAVLRAANSEGGQRMLTRKHQLKVGGAGIVGYVSQGGRPRIALNTGADAIFFNNPDLPETRSEMALPLKIGSIIIGVMDVQSQQIAAFDEENISILSTLANQVAIVIQNSQIKENAGVSSTFDAKQNIQLSSEQLVDGYSYLPDGTLSSAIVIENPAREKAIASSETVVLERASGNIPPSLAVPVKIRDTVIGVIHIEAAQNNRKWTDDEVALVQSISERAALALENAKLFEETEKRAQQERVVAQATSRISESTNMERILHTTIRELGRTLGASRAFIQLTTPSDDEVSGNGKSS